MSSLISDPPAILRANRVLSVGQWRSLMVFYWLGPAPDADVVKPAMDAAEQALKALGPQKGARLVVLAPDTPMPDERARISLSREVPRLEKYLHTSATVHGADGFKGAAIRAAISTMQLIARPKLQDKIFGTVDEAARWLHPLCTAEGMRCTRWLSHCGQ